MATETHWLEVNSKAIFLIVTPLLIWRINYALREDAFSFCLFKNFTGKNCYGCGLLRGISALLHMDIIAMIHLNPINLITIPLLAFLYFKQSWRIIQFYLPSSFDYRFLLKKLHK